MMRPARIFTLSLGLILCAASLSAAGEQSAAGPGTNPGAAVTGSQAAAATPAAGALETEIKALRAALEAQKELLEAQEKRIDALESERRAAHGAPPAGDDAAAAPGTAAVPTPAQPHAPGGESAAHRAGPGSESESLAGRLKNIGPFSFSGDIKLRDEPFFGGPADNSQVRNRLRYRLRFNVNAKSGDFSGGFTLATGDVNTPISTMQTANQFFTRKPFRLDRAFLSYNPRFFHPLTLTGGKFAQPWYGTELLWDKDLNPEGVAQTLAFDLESNPLLKRVAFVGFALPFAETARTEAGDRSIGQSAVYGGQVQTEWLLAGWLRFSAYAGFFNWHNPGPVALASAVAGASSPDLGLLRLSNNGNQNSALTTTATTLSTGQHSITSAQFASQFALLDAIARFDIKTHSEKWPLVVLADFVQNTRACANVPNLLPAPANTATQTFSQSFNAPCDPRQRQGYWLETRVGRSREAGDWTFAYTRMFIEREAVLGAFNYSGLREGSNVTQHRAELLYQLSRNVQLGFTGLFGRPLVTSSSPATENFLKRLRFDVTYIF